MERERECKEALAQQKRRITRQWEALNRLKKRCEGGKGAGLAWLSLAVVSALLLHSIVITILAPRPASCPLHPCSHAASDGRAAADNARLGDEYRAVTRAFTHLQSKYAHFKAADLGRFSRVRGSLLGTLLLVLLARPGCIPRARERGSKQAAD